jgi:predicted acylesterase/phospholipase RssA
MNKYTILCLNGGGVRGIFQVGALKAFDIQDLYTIFPDGVYGISIGSILCALIAFKFTMDEMVRLTCEIFKLEELLDKPRLSHFLEFDTRVGIDSGIKIYECLKSIFEKKGMDFSRLTIGDAAIPLNIVASDLTKCKVVTFCKSIRVWDAIRASISIPLIFTPHIIKKRVFVDGAILCRNVFNTVPEKDRHKALYISTNRGKIDEVNTFSSRQFMNHILQVQTAIETKNTIMQYPKNTCVLEDRSVGMLDFNPDVPNMLEKGELTCRLFLSNSLL